jgi:hypothetical protein
MGKVDGMRAAGSNPTVIALESLKSALLTTGCWKLTVSSFRKKNWTPSA